MSLFSRLFKSKAPVAGAQSSSDLIETVGLLLLAARERQDDSLRHSPRLGELLGLLWQADAQALNTVHRVLSSVEKVDREFVETLAERLRAGLPAAPSTPESRYEAISRALRADVEAIALQPSLLIERPARSHTAIHLVNVLTLAHILLVPELHKPLCELLVAYNRTCRDCTEKDERIPYQDLVRENIDRFLASTAPEAMPYFWSMLRDEAVSEEFWPCLRRIRDIDSVPYLLDLLPAAHEEQDRSALSIAGQQEVVKVLREIGDMRAVPILLAIERRLPPELHRPTDALLAPSVWEQFLIDSLRERSALAQLAGQAARHIARNSRASEAPLQRLSEEPPHRDKDLMRPSEPTTETMIPGEHLRPSESPGATNDLP